MADPEKPRRRRRTEESAARSSAAPAADDAAPTKKRPAERLPQLEERAPRQALLLGGGLLLAGLAIVGTGVGGMGAVVALVGLAAIIYGIHAFGRLGGEDLTPSSADAVARSSSTVQLVLGVVIAVVGLAVAVAGYLGLAPPGSIQTAVIAFVAGGFWALRAAMALSPTKNPRRAA
jgi:hypothetical protein